MLYVKNPFGVPIEDANEDLLNRRIGERIKEIREARKLTQAKLGEMVGLNANRIQQYENGARKPKLQLIKEIAKALEVEPLALLNPSAASNIGVMYTLFEMEKYHKLMLKEIDGQIYICFGVSPYETETRLMNEQLEEWLKVQRQRDFDLLSAESEEEKEEAITKYNLWQWNFPASSERLINPPESTEEQLENLIAAMQEELYKIRSKKNDE